MWKRILATLQIFIYTSFCSVYAYTPNKLGEQTETEVNNACKGQEGKLIFQNGEPVICPPKTAEASGTLAQETTSFLDKLDIILNIIVSFTVFAVLFSLAFSGVQLASSSGEPHKKQKAKERIKLSLLALAIIGGLKFIIGSIIGFSLGNY